MMLKARFLGVPEVQLDSNSLITSLNGRALALLAYLCVTRQQYSRSMLADLLWGDQSEQQARTNLRYVLRDLRKVVDDYLIVDRQTISFNQDLPHWIDVNIFADNLAAGSALTDSSGSTDILKELANLYTDEFMTGFYVQNAPNFERWMFAERRYLHDLAVQGLQVCVQRYWEAGEYEDGLTVNRRLLALEPWREEAHRQRMRLLAASGQRNAALMQYKTCCQTLEEELDVAPMEETTALYNQIKSGEWFALQDASAHRPELTVATGARAQASSHRAPDASIQATDDAGFPIHADLGSMPSTAHFVGRQAEMAELHTWIERERRPLVALFGLNGQGKSALAAHYVQTLLDDDPVLAPGFESIIWRTLDADSTCTQVLQKWVQQLSGIPSAEVPTDFDSLVTALLAILNQRRCLLVLDGVESILRPEIHNTRPLEKSFDALFRLLAEREHRSCLLLTSRVRPAVLTHADERNGLFALLEVEGLTVKDSGTLLHMYGIERDPAIYQQLYRRYAGNPLLLRWVSNVIHTLFGGDVAAFLQEEIILLNDIRTDISQQLTSLASLEQQILHILATAGQPLDRQTLREKLTPPPTKEHYFHALQTLQRSFLIHKTGMHIKLPELLSACLAEYEVFQSWSFPGTERLPLAVPSSN